jgi:predicted dehydrogenase
MADRRTFIGQCARGAVGIAVSGLVSSRRVLGANDRVRFGLIGCGSRGKEIFQAAMRSPNAEAVAAADVYTRRLDEVKALAPAIKPYKDFRQLLDDKNVDAVLIATPQHQHALNFVPAIQAGKDVYQEKTMAFSPDHAKRMRKALDGSGRVVQIGIQMISGPGIKMVREYATPERMGVITHIHTHHYRNAPYGGWMREIPGGLRREPRRLAHVPGRSRAARLRSAAIRELAVLLGLLRRQRLREHGSPGRLLAHRAESQDPACRDHDGGNYLSPKMDPPDVMDVTMHHTAEKILFTWNSMFTNNYFGEGHDLLLGTKGTIVHDETDKPRYIPQEKGARLSEASTGSTGEYAEATDAHMQNFFDCVRSRKEPNCPFEIGFRSAIACQMAVRSYREGRTVTWDEKAGRHRLSRAGLLRRSSVRCR